MHRILHFLALLFIALPSLAQKSPPSPFSALLQTSCADDLKQWCPEAQGLRGQMMCLAQNKHQLSEACKEGSQRLAQASKQAAARGGGSMSALGGMTAFTPPVPLLVMEGRVYPANDSPRMTDYRLNFSTPVYKTDKDALAMSMAYGHLNFQDGLSLDSGVAVPQNLKRAELGAQYSRTLEGQRSWGLRGSLGYTGDTLFKNSRDLSFSLIGNYSYPTSEVSSWVLTLFFSNNSPIGNFIPIPGFMYIYRTPHFTGIFGIPIAAIQWTPAFPWSVSVSLFGPTFNSEVAYGSVDTVQVFTGFQWTQQLYLLESRTRDEDRLRIEELRALVGVRTPLFQTWSAEVQVGQSFNRSIYLGDGMFNKDGGSTDLEDSIYFNTVLRAAF